jgi:hypothetical protein
MCAFRCKGLLTEPQNAKWSVRVPTRRRGGSGGGGRVGGRARRRAAGVGGARRRRGPAWAGRGAAGRRRGWARGRRGWARGRRAAGVGGHEAASGRRGWRSAQARVVVRGGVRAHQGGDRLGRRRCRGLSVGVWVARACGAWRRDPGHPDRRPGRLCTRCASSTGQRHAGVPCDPKVPFTGAAEDSAPNRRPTAPSCRMGTRGRRWSLRRCAIDAGVMSGCQEPAGHAPEARTRPGAHGRPDAVAPPLAITPLMSANPAPHHPKRRR